MCRSVFLDGRDAGMDDSRQCPNSLFIEMQGAGPDITQPVSTPILAGTNKLKQVQAERWIIFREPSNRKSSMLGALGLMATTRHTPQRTEGRPPDVFLANAETDVGPENEVVAQRAPTDLPQSFG